jgi:predicted kinase
MATAHLIHGFLGSGKTTFARRLESELPALRFTHDEWIARLYGDDPAINDFAIFFSRVSAQIDRLWPRCLALGVDVGPDLNFGRVDNGTKQEQLLMPWEPRRDSIAFVRRTKLGGG